MSTPFDDPLLEGTGDIGIAVPMPDLHPEPVIDEAVAPDDWSLEPEFSSFILWCTMYQRWASEYRPTSSSPWRCQACGSRNHHRQDHEEI